jgi:hypothetical protein
VFRYRWSEDTNIESSAVIRRLKSIAESNGME